MIIFNPPQLKGTHSLCTSNCQCQKSAKLTITNLWVSLCHYSVFQSKTKIFPPSFIFINTSKTWAYLKIVSCCQMIHQVRVKNWDHESCSHKQIEHDVPLSRSSPLTFKIENNLFGISGFIKIKYEFNFSKLTRAPTTSQIITIRLSYKLKWRETRMVSFSNKEIWLKNQIG